MFDRTTMSLPSNAPSDASWRAREPWLARVVLGIALALTALAWYVADRSVAMHARDRFEARSDDVRDAIVERMRACEGLVRGAAGLFAASTEVTRNDWRAYVRTLRVAERWYGIQFVGYNVRVRSDERAAHVARVRTDVPAYSIRPEGERGEYFPVLYVEPTDDASQRTLGFDSHVDPVRRAAMEHARDTGDVAITGAVTLAPDGGKTGEPALLMYAPVYGNDAVHASAAQRRVALRGYVTAAFRMRDLVQGALGRVEEPDVDFAIYDGKMGSSGALLYASHSQKDVALESGAGLSRTLEAEIGGHTWTLRFAARPPLRGVGERTALAAIALAALAVNLLLFRIIGSLAAARRRAEQAAAEGTLALAQSRKEFRVVAETAHEGIVATDGSGSIVYANPAVEGMFGYASGGLTGLPLSALEFREGPGRPALLADPASIGEAVFEGLGRRRDQSTFPLEISLSRWRVGGNSSITVILRDLTLRKEVERLKDALASNDAPVDPRRVEAAPPENAPIETAPASSAPLESARVDIAPFLERVVALHAALALRHGVTCRVVAPAAPLAVVADADGLTKVMTNLVSNAVKFSEPGAEVVVAATAAGDRVLIEVSDAGRGIPPELHDRIFKPNARGAGSRSATRDRGGRGLAGTKSLVEAMHGTIDFTSAVGVGTTFWIDLPLAGAPVTTLVP